MKDSRHAKLCPSVVWLPIIPCIPHQVACKKTKQISPLSLGIQVFHFHYEAPDSKTKDGTQELIFRALIINHQEANGGQLEDLQMFQFGTEADGAQRFPHIPSIRRSQMLTFAAVLEYEHNSQGLKPWQMKVFLRNCKASQL